MKKKFIEFMRQRGVECYFHYNSLNRSKYFRKNNKYIRIKNSELVADTIVRLPTNISAYQKQNKILKNIEFFFRKFN